MYDRIHQMVSVLRTEILDFAKELIRIRSVTGNECEVAQTVLDKMQTLGFKNPHIDKTGNVIGCMGTGPKSVLFDAHMDTVDVVDAESWTHDPFGAELCDGKLYGRGSMDMKGALAASVYAAVIANQLELLKGKRIFVAGSVMEEDYDGVAVNQLLQDNGIFPDYAIFGEGTDLQICRGHHGRALIKLTINGKASHASRPESGRNPIYIMQTVIARIQKLAAYLAQKTGEHGSIAATNISCDTASNNSVPQSATIILDRRLCVYENMETIESEMQEILEEIDGGWCICDILGRSWTGEPMLLHSYLPAWEVPEDSPLVIAAQEACTRVLGKKRDVIKVNFATDAVATAGVHKIPTIVLGAGSFSNAHGKDEYCPVDELIQACEIYVHLCQLLT